MKHLPVITKGSARCSCGGMVPIMRPSAEAIGAFTKRTYADWEDHIARKTVAQLTMFDVSPIREPMPDSPGPLFG